MATVYYVIPGQTTRTNEEPASPALTAPWVAVSLGDYQDELGAILTALGAFYIKASRSNTRTSPIKLDGNAIDAGRPYAVFVEDRTELGITQVEFDLDGVPFNTELTAPWDFNQTDMSNNAIKYSFSSGFHTIDAHVTLGGGSIITLTATFEVD